MYKSGGHRFGGSGSRTGKHNSVSDMRSERDHGKGDKGREAGRAGRAGQSEAAAFTRARMGGAAHAREGRREGEMEKGGKSQGGKEESRKRF